MLENAEKQTAKKSREPYYPLNEETRKIVMEYIEKSRDIKMGNVSFSFYPTRGISGADFYMSEMKDFWELVVSSGDSPHKKRDIYKIHGLEIRYDYSETDGGSDTC